MTITEAANRAREIWGAGRFFSVQLRQDGGADVTLLRTFLASDVRGRTFTAHRLSASGRPICHVDCESLVVQDATKS